LEPSATAYNQVKASVKLLGWVCLSPALTKHWWGENVTKEESDRFIRELIESTRNKTLDENWVDYDDPGTTEDDQLLIIRCVLKGKIVFLDRRYFMSASGLYFYNIMRYGVGEEQISWNYHPDDPLTDELWDTIREFI